MSQVMYRSLEKKDYETVKFLINEAFGFHEFIKDEKFLDRILTLYLQNCIIASSYSQVAVKDNVVIGIILGDASTHKKKIRQIHNLLSYLKSISLLAISSKENKKALKEFSRIQAVYDEIIKDKKNQFQGCIQLFIVSAQSRGLGVGKTLVSYLAAYMKGHQVKSIYLYTDTRCNYGFYEHQNFERLNEKELHFDAFDTTLGVYLYGYEY